MLGTMNEEIEKRSRALLAQPAAEAGALLDAMPLPERVGLVLAAGSGRDRMEMILRTSRPAELVAALAPEDLVLTIKDIGDQDALPLLELSSDPQLTYLLDLETWVRDGMDMGRMMHWIGLLSACGQDRLLRWLLAADFELLVLMFERLVLKIDREQLESLPDLLQARLVTPDDTHHLLVKVGADYALTSELVELVYREDTTMFFALHGNLGSTPPAELEEMAARWRNGRLADRGWPAMEEAFALYQPVEPGALSAASAWMSPPRAMDNPPAYPLQPRDPGRLLAAGLARIDQEPNRARVATQLAGLINRVVVADGLLQTEIESLEQAATRVQGHLEIGLSLLGATHDAAAARLLENLPLLHVFQAAHGAIRERTRRARRLCATPAGSLRSLLPDPLPLLLDALGAKRPLFVPPATATAREFGGPEDLALLDDELDRLESMLRLGDVLGLSDRALPAVFPAGSHPAAREGLDFATLLLTAFARRRLGLEPACAPLPVARLAELVEGLPRDFSPLRETLASWVTGLEPDTVESAGATIDELTRLLQDEILRHRPEEIDPRFVRGLWLLGDQ